jgi:Kef-type K+ transport system membrane component KefB
MHPALVAAGGESGLPALVYDIGLALLVAGLLAAVFTRIKIPTIAAFLVAGVILGPVGELIDDRANIDTIAQLGLILLLFLIGLEIDVKALAAGGRTIITSGLLQFPLSAAFGLLVFQGLFLAGFGGAVLGGDYAPLYAGLTIGASSTLLIVALFQQSFTLDTVTGRVALALLVFQDIWAIVVLALQPNLDSPQVGPIFASFGGIVLLAAAATLVAHTALKVGFSWVAKQPATMLVASLAWCFAVVIGGVNIDAALESGFGIHPGLAVSAGMGALIAGATIAALPFRIEITRQVSVVRDFFVTLFFVGIGMTIPAPDDVGVVLVALAIAALAILSRFLVMLPILYFTGLDRRNATLVSTKLAPISEFALVIAFLGMQLGHIDEQVNAAIVLAFVATAVVSPFLSDGLTRCASPRPLLNRLVQQPPADTGEGRGIRPGAARGASHRVVLLHELGVAAPDLLTRTLVVDFNVGIHERISELGPHVIYGDFTSADTLRHAGVDRCRVVLCTIPDDVLVSATSVGVVETVRGICPEVMIVATAISFPEVRALYEAGADYVLLPRIDAARAALTAVQAALNGTLGQMRAEASGAADRGEVLE